jgi:small subunit ribosomal protein S6
MTDELQKQELPKEPETQEQKVEDQELDDIDEVFSGHYEMVYIVSSSYTSEEVKPIKNKLVDLIKEQDGEITNDEDLGKVKFAYPIKHESHGYYQLLEFDMPKANLQKLNNGLSLTSEVIRFLIVKKKIKTDDELKKEKALQEKLAKKKEKQIEEIKTKKEEEKEKPKKETTKEKVSLEELDKKLDELLDTDDIV